MSEMGMAMMGSGIASGEDRAVRAAEMAIRSPLLEDVDLHGAKGILVNISAGVDLGLDEFTQVGDTIEEFASEDATVVVGTVIDPELGDEIRVTVVATGISQAEAMAAKPKVAVDNTRKADGSVDYKSSIAPLQCVMPSLQKPQRKTANQCAVQRPGLPRYSSVFAPSG